MTEKELKKLSRAELLELLLEQTRETERLRVELAEVRRALEDKNLRMEKCGDLAQAVLAVNGVVDAAQAAAKQYLDNIILMEARTRERCREIMEHTQAEAAKGSPAPVNPPKARKAQPPKTAEQTQLPREKTLDQLIDEARQLIGE